MKTSNFFDDLGILIQPEKNESLLDLDPKEIRKLFDQHRLVLFRGFSVEVTDFEQFTDLFSIEHLRHVDPKLRPNVNAEAAIAEVLIGNDYIELHREMGYSPSKPKILWLHCITPPEYRGTTTVCDALKFYEMLSESTREFFQRNPLMYVHCLEDYGWKNLTGETDKETALNKISKMDGVRNAKITSDGKVYFEYITSAIIKTRFDNKPAFLNSIRNIKQYEFGQVKVRLDGGGLVPNEIMDELLRTGVSITRYVSWKAQDITMIDNDTVMHGRDSFVGKRKIAVRFSKAA